jgi:hypothetical protein
MINEVGSTIECGKAGGFGWLIVQSFFLSEKKKETVLSYFFMLLHNNS